MTLIKKQRPPHLQWPLELQGAFEVSRYQLTATSFEQVNVPVSHTL